jgi:hypothetical protein
MVRQTMSDLRHRRGGATSRQSSSMLSASNLILLMTLFAVGTLWYFTLSLQAAPPDPYANSEILGPRSDKKTIIARREPRSKASHRNRPELQSVLPPPISADPLRTTDAALLNLPRTPLPFKPAVPWLGVLIDGGRRYFPMEWLFRVVDRLADMNYNLIHLRLTDDQTFNVLLDSHPELAFPTSVDNPGMKVYSAQELRELTQYAKKKGIRIMPEVNVPGHAGSWAGVPGLIVHCPEFICSEGYGIPINVTSPVLRPLLTNVIREIVDIFDDPPFLHLGGDEVNMAGPCFEEVGKKVFDYPAFELVLKQIVKDVGFPEDRIVRWEMTGQDQLIRAGKIEHFWETHPGDRHEPIAGGPFFVSHGMYFDTNGDENSLTVVRKSNKGFSLDNGRLPVAIIAGCFELSVQFWFDRNILGRLLSVAMGASNLTFIDTNNGEENVVFQHKKFCNDLGFGPTVCEKEGTPMIPTHVYHEQWKADWVVWKKDICQRVTDSVPTRAFRPLTDMYVHAVGKAATYYWSHFLVEFSKNEVRPVHLPGPSSDDVDKLRKHVVPHTGVILDTVNSIVPPSRLKDIIEKDVAPLGFNIIQMRLVNNHGFSLKVDETDWEHSHATAEGGGARPYHIQDLALLVGTARRLGIEMMPEISVSSDGGGWINTGFMLPCAEHFCQSNTSPNNVNHPLLLPLLFTVISELRHVFSSKFFHLGSDERIGSMPCFEEVGIVPDFDNFERKLTQLLKTNGILPDHILRTDNARHRMHEGRTGSITQLRAGSNEMDEPDDIVFFTVDVEDGDAWTVYQRTKDLVFLEPLGIMAETRALMKSHWDEVELPKRLLAFSMAISELPTAEDSAAFAKSFKAICETLSLDTDCTPPGKLKRRTSYIVDSEKFRQKVCDARTEESQKYVAKFVPPFYGNSTAKPVADKKKH